MGPENGKRTGPTQLGPLNMEHEMTKDCPSSTVLGRAIAEATGMLEIWKLVGRGVLVSAPTACFGLLLQAEFSPVYTVPLTIEMVMIRWRKLFYG